ncbi:hypothetical protein [Stenomitos frigidus]|nr:hypothetical protein [Stenomitos frigidus]
MSLLAGMTIATIGLELPVLAAPQPAPVLVSQVACRVSNRISMIAVYTTANPQNPEVLGRNLRGGTLIGLAETLTVRPPERIQITDPINGFVAYTGLDCGRSSSNPSTKTTACRKVRSDIVNANVFRAPNWNSSPIAPIDVTRPVFVTQTAGRTTSFTDVNGEVWVEIDLQLTFSRNFGLSPSVGWLPATDPNSQLSTLVNGCG